MATFALDISTVYVLTGFSSLAGASILIWLRGDHRGNEPAMSVFAAAILTLGIGFVCFALRGEPLGRVAPILGYAAFGAAATLVWTGTRYLLGLSVPIAAAGGATALYFAVIATLHDASAQHALARILTSGIFMIMALGLAAYDAHTSPWTRSLRSVRLMRTLFILFAAIIGVRMLMFAFQAIPLLPDGTSPSGWLRMSFAVVFGSMPFAITVAVLSISNSQLSIRLRQMATTDELTGLVSRRSLHQAGERLLARSGGGCIALMMIDLDNFKSVNDRHGHGVGDDVLRHVAAVLRQSLRPDSLIVRYGGDEFCAMVAVPGEAAAFVVAERLRAAMEAAPYPLGDKRIAITVSVGVTVHGQGSTLRELLDEADRRAYRAKSQGRNRVVAEDPIPAG